jgi:hypothetical protein
VDIAINRFELLERLAAEPESRLQNEGAMGHLHSHHHQSWRKRRMSSPTSPNMFEPLFSSPLDTIPSYSYFLVNWDVSLLG